MKNLFIMQLVILVAILAILAMAGTACATPFFVVDTDKDTTSCLVQIDDNEEYVASVPLRIDLVGISKGKHTIKVKAVNVWGVSSVLPFDFTKKLPDVPSNGRLEE